ncbi:hypothetical protein JCM11641_003027 [Rhodosporidiobolus odoratus]
MDRPLTSDQRETLDQLNSITARSSQEERRESEEVLREVGFNLEASLLPWAAITRIYDGPTTASSSAQHSYPPSQDDHSQVDDSLLPTSPSSRSTRRRFSGTGGMGTGGVGLRSLRQALAVPIAVLSWPVGLLYNLGAVLLTFLARLLRLRPSTASFRPRNPFDSLARPRTILSPAAAATAWIRSVESATGLSCPSLSADTDSSSTAFQVGSSSSTTRRQQPRREDEARLPAFFVGGYDAAMKKARDEMRLLLVILSSSEHEQDETFKRDVLSSPLLTKALEEENVLVWGGDVGDRDAYQVGQTLAYVSLPFLAFISLQPSGPNPGNPATAPLTSPRMRLLTRLEATATEPVLSATVVHTHLITAVLPKARPYLNRLNVQKQQRDSDRRAQQANEQRIEQAARRDEERVLAVRRREQERRREEERQLAAAEAAAIEAEEAARRADLARRWRAWKRAELATRGEAPSGPGSVRCVVRLGDGTRVMRTFGAEEETMDVYAWVECELSATDDGGEISGTKPAGYEQVFHFRLATAFPRWVVPLAPHLASVSTADLSTSASGKGTTVGEAFRNQGGTVNLVVDGLEERRRMSMSSQGDSDEQEEEDE